MSDKSYAPLGVVKAVDSKGDFGVIHADSTLHNYSNNLYQELKFKTYRMVIA